MFVFQANVVPFFKKGDKSKAENNRHISLTSLSFKLLKHLVRSNIMCHLDKFQIVLMRTKWPLTTVQLN